MTLKLLLQDHHAGELGTLKAGDLVDDSEPRYTRLVGAGAPFVTYNAGAMAAQVAAQKAQALVLPPRSQPSLTAMLQAAGAYPSNPSEVVLALAANTLPISFNNVVLGDAPTPIAMNDVANKAYVDAVGVGLRQFKASVRMATTVAIVLTGLQTIDGIVGVANDRVLVKNQAAQADNGIYTMQAGAWVRATDADTSAEVTSGMFMFVDEGATNADTGWVLATNNPITLGVTNLLFTKFSSIGGDVVGPASSTDNAIPRFDGAGGKTIQGSSVIIDDSNRIGLGTAVPTHTVTHSSTSTGVAAYNTVDQVTNLERSLASWIANVYTIKTEAAGSGSTRNLSIGALCTLVFGGTGNGGSVLTSTGAGITVPEFNVTHTAAMASTTAVQTGISVTGTVNQTSGTGGYNGILVNPTLTAVGSAGANLLRLQSGSADRMRVNSVGDVIAEGSLIMIGGSTIHSGNAITAGGTTGRGYKFSSVTNFGTFYGSGAPTLSAAKGSMYFRSDGSGTNDRFYINTDGGTTWTAGVTVA